MIGDDLLRISAALARHLNGREARPQRTAIESSTEQKMTKNNAAQAGENPCRNESSLDSRRGAAVPERGQEPRVCPGRPSTGQVDRGDGGLIASRGRRLSQAFPAGSVCPRSGLRPGGLAPPLIVLARAGSIGPSLAQ